MMDVEPVRCSCGNWLGVQRADLVESRHRGRVFRTVDGGIDCERCGATVQVVAGRPVDAPMAAVTR